VSRITTHVLDTAAGAPATGVAVSFDGVAVGSTDADGRLLVAEDASAGAHRLTFETGALSAFYPEVSIAFVVAAGEAHYHVPLLLSPFGYSTYRGS
jgi:5-hydroxyisourate hydrolase